jgi:hypothetical protein
MYETKVKNRFKLAVERASSQSSISGQDVRAILEYQNRELAIEKGEPLDDYDLNILLIYAAEFN